MLAVPELNGARGDGVHNIAESLLETSQKRLVRAVDHGYDAFVISKLHKDLVACLQDHLQANVRNTLRNKNNLYRN